MITDFIVNVLPWFLSAITIYSMFLAGDKNPNAWLVGLANQALWLIWIFTAHEWGFLPMNIAFWVVYYRNYVKWST
jgi:hypothetical protein